MKNKRVLMVNICIFSSLFWLISEFEEGWLPLEEQTKVKACPCPEGDLHQVLLDLTGDEMLRSRFEWQLSWAPQLWKEVMKS